MPDRRPLPDWFDNAKFGIFIHWGLYSVPAWAEGGVSMLEREVAPGEEPMSSGLRHNTYAEWYLNTISIDGSPAQQHHLETYGDKPYDDFAGAFAAATEGWRAAEWGELFARAGAKYAVLTTKHHDGYLLWPSATENPFKPDWHAQRDLVGDFAAAMRERDIRVGLYYSGGLDWTFQGLPIESFRGMIAAIPQRDDYGAYADAHWRELIERYAPSILWNDIHYPTSGDSEQLIADYYGLTPDGVVNNRFDTPGVAAGTATADFITPEYSTIDHISKDKWETCRGIGKSFGFNQAEDPDDLLSIDEAVHLLIDVVSKNGNLLLNVGPAADGTIPWAQAQRLLGLGWWLAQNGEAIYATRPWIVAEGKADEELAVRFTCAPNGDVFAIVLGTPAGSTVTLEGLRLEGAATVSRVDRAESLPWSARGDSITIDLLGRLSPSPAYAFRVSPGSALRPAVDPRS